MAGQQKSYCTPDNTSPNRNRVDVGCAPNGVLQLWVIEFEVTGSSIFAFHEAVGKGCGLCKATNAQEAEKLLKSSGIYNGRPYLYKVIRIEQVIVPPCNGLMAEQVVTYEDLAP